MPAIVPDIVPAIVPVIVPLDHADPAAIERLLDATFGIDRHARTAYRLRAGVAWLPGLSFAALDAGRLVGSVQCWPVALTGAGGVACPLVLLGPVAVDPARQRGGLGRMLTSAAIAAARAAGAPPLVLIGDRDYYGRFGFSAAATAGWDLPGPFERHRLLVLAADDAALPATGMIGPAPPVPAPPVPAPPGPVPPVPAPYVPVIAPARPGA